MIYGHYAAKCVALISRLGIDDEALLDFVMGKVSGEPGRLQYIINSVLPLENSLTGGDGDYLNHVMGKSPFLRRSGGGTMTIEQKDAPGAFISVIRFEFFSDFIQDENPPLIAKIADALKAEWENVEVWDDPTSLAGKKSKEAAQKKSTEEGTKRRQSEEWRAKGLCTACGGQLGFLKKCKSCGAKN